jgi:hypothetical protein
MLNWGKGSGVMGPGYMGRRCAGASFRDFQGYIRAIVAVCGLIALGFLASPNPAEAVPSFARQTGQPCAACHTAFPELTPFGRRFKLSGYTMQGGDTNFPPVAAMLMPGYTHTQAKMDSPIGPNPPPPGLKSNDNLVTQQVTGLYAGKIYGNLGGFIQVSGDPVGGGVGLDGTDIRYVDAFKMFGKDAFFGIDANNQPSVQDVWNTVPAWSYPQFSSGITPFGPPDTHISNLGMQVGGVGMYVFWNDMLYAELTAYGGLSKTALEVLGEQPGPTPDLQRGVMPYWRLALEPHWGDHYLMVGTFGMYGQTIPGGVPGTGTDDYLDIGFDSQYQYDGDKYSVTLKVSDIIETQKLNSSFFQGSATSVSNHMNSFKANGTFVWDHTYSLSAGYFDVSGTADGMYGLNAVSGNPLSPYGNGLVFDVSYLPFSHGSPGPYSTYNARIGVQYTQYLKLYGGTSNFDGLIGTPGAGGTHNASGNNTLFLYAWMAF